MEKVYRLVEFLGGIMSYGIPCDSCGSLGGDCICTEVFVSVVEFSKPVEPMGDITEQLILDEIESCQK